jgi:hypothetical protein
LYNAVPSGPTVEICRLVFVPSVKFNPAGSISWGRHRFPGPVSLRGRDVNEMLKFVAFEPSPRLMKTYVKGW